MKVILLLLTAINLWFPPNWRLAKKVQYAEKRLSNNGTSSIHQKTLNSRVTPTVGVSIVMSMGTIVADGRANVFGLDADGTLWTCFDTGHGWAWTSLGKPTGNIRIVASMGTAAASGRSNVFGIDAGGTLFTCFDNGHGWEWANLGKPNGNIPIVASMGTLINDKTNMQIKRYTNVFGLDGNGSLWTCFDNGHGWEWASLGSPENKGVIRSMGATNINSRANVFALDHDLTLWTCFDNSHGWEWAKIGNTGIGLGYLYMNMGTGISSVFALDGLRNLYIFEANAHGWERAPLYTPGNAPITASMGTSRSHGRFNVFTLGGNGTLYTCFDDGLNRNWQWANLGQPNGNIPIVLSMGTIITSIRQSYPKELNTALQVVATVAGEIADSKHKVTIDMVKNTVTTSPGDTQVLGLDANGNLWTCFDNGNGWQWGALGQPSK